MRRITKKKYPCVVLGKMAVLPGMVIHFDINTAAGAKAVEKAMIKDRKLFATMDENTGAAGCICAIKQVVKLPGNVLRVLVEGQMRARLFDVEKDECKTATVKEIIPADDYFSSSEKSVMMSRIFLRPSSVTIPRSASLLQSISKMRELFRSFSTTLP